LLYLAGGGGGDAGGLLHGGGGRGGGHRGGLDLRGGGIHLGGGRVHAGRDLRGERRNIRGEARDVSVSHRHDHALEGPLGRLGHDGGVVTQRPRGVDGELVLVDPCGADLGHRGVDH